MRKNILIMFAFFITVILTGCFNSNDEEKQLESGLSYLNEGDEPIQSIYCGYRSNLNEFDIDETELTFYVGIDESNFNLASDIELIQIYAKKSNDPSAEKVVLQEINNFNTDSFEYEKVIVNASKYNLNYDYSTQIIIPEELFDSSSGTIEVGYTALYKNDLDEYVTAFECFNKIHFQKDNDRIILSSDK